MTNNNSIKNDIQSLSQAEKQNLAKHMASPFRCGGSFYIDGKLIYRYGEHFISQDELNEHKYNREQWIIDHDHSICLTIGQNQGRLHPRVKTKSK